ncbi:hypothetical protein CKAH01_15487 [Colletotrichum kahawae]|uniref:Uncharacterized protein n=1 Tax=Colletotrichum kahawae TaxID=34407 RepID=A0AAD9YID7_COLKA|nr:hypothetical protein CKAH01_15487 [Colletotrichum kahawae]
MSARSVSTFTPSVNTSSECTSTADNHKLMILAEATIKMPAMMQKAEATAAAEAAGAAETLVSLSKSPGYCKVHWGTVLGSSTNKNKPPKNANGRTPLPSGRGEFGLQSYEPATISKTAMESSAASQNAFHPVRAASPESEKELKTAPYYAAVSQNTPQALSEEAAEPALKQDADKIKKEKLECFCSKCMRGSATGQMFSRTTWIEHQRAEKRQNEGKPAGVKCSRCTKLRKDCMVDNTGKSCAGCTWVKEKCCRDGQTSQRQRSGGDGKSQKKSRKVPVVDAVVPKQAKRKASEPMEGPKKAQKLADGARHTFTKAHVKAEPKEPSVCPNNVKATDGGNNMPVVGASRGSSQDDTKKKKRNGWTTVN